MSRSWKSWSPRRVLYLRVSDRTILLAGLWLAWLVYCFGLGSYSPSFSLVCPFRWLTGLPCPLCGLTRSCASLLHGHMVAALQFNPLGPLAILSFPCSLLYQINRNEINQ